MYDTSQDNCPNQADWVSHNALLWCCWHAAVSVMHCAVQCVYVLTRVMYNTAQVKMGRGSRRAAWADFSVALRVWSFMASQELLLHSLWGFSKMEVQVLQKAKIVFDQF